MSINLLLPQEDDAVIWRGPLIGNTIKQFWEDVLWGRLDYLIVDLPPGTADAPLTVMQSLPLSGVIIVFSPQELARLCDEGNIERYDSELLSSFAEAFLRAMSDKAK
jgi:Mrp family chromosome partitioning ATPase